MDRTVKSVPTIKGSDYPTFEGAMNAAMEAAEGADGIAAVGFSLGELPESFWDDEAKNQKEELGSDDTRPTHLYEAVSQFLEIAREKARNPIDFEEIAQLEQLNEDNENWLIERGKAIDTMTDQEKRDSSCIVAYQLELFCIAQVERSFAYLGIKALEEFNVRAMLAINEALGLLSSMKETLTENAPDQLKVETAFNYGFVHDVLSAALPESKHCDSFINTFDRETRIETLYNRLSRRLEVNQEEFPLNRYK